MAPPHPPCCLCATNLLARHSARSGAPAHPLGNAGSALPMEPRERRVPGGSSGTLCCVVTRSEQPASLARRVVAVLIDGVAVLVIWVFVWLAIRERLGLDVTSVASINAANAALYEVALIALFGQTVGKAAVGIAVVNASG